MCPLWLRTLQRYFQDMNQPLAMYGRLAGHWLPGNALSLLECELNDPSDSGLSPTWDMIKKQWFLITARSSLLRSKEPGIGNVLNLGDSWIIELRVIIQTLKATDFAPSPMHIAEHFINGLKADVRNYVEDNAPQGWRTDPEPLYGKANQYEVNQHSHTTKLQAMPKVHNAVFRI